MTDKERRTAAARFAADWKDRGDEKQETQAFWLTLLQKVYGVDEPEKYIAFEVPVKLDHTSFIDGYISETRVLIEQKGMDIDLRKGPNDEPETLALAGLDKEFHRLDLLVDTGKEHIKKEMEIE